MSILRRVFFTGLTATGVVLASTCVFVPLLGGPDAFGDLSQHAQLMLEEMRRTDDIVSRDQAVLRCLDGKHKVASEVVAGRLTLPQAADRFRELRTELAATHEDGPSLSGQDDEESLCRHVIDWVATSLREEPERAGKVVARLEDDLRQHLAARTRGAV
jgi:hypothetical protein